MQTVYLRRNICIGLIDGVTIPLAVAAGVSRLAGSSSIVVIACLAVALAGSLTMAAGSYLEGRKYDQEYSYTLTALTIGASYLAGGIMVASPFVYLRQTGDAMVWSLVLSGILLLMAGYSEGRLHGSNGWAGAFRIFLTAMLAAGATFLVAGLFR